MVLLGFISVLYHHSNADRQTDGRTDGQTALIWGHYTQDSITSFPPSWDSNLERVGVLIVGLRADCVCVLCCDCVLLLYQIILCAISTTEQISMGNYLSFLYFLVLCN